MKRRPSAEAVISFALVAGSMFFVLLALHPSNLFLRTTPAGGDMGAHVWAPDYLRHHLFTHGRITGWSPDWYAGFPALTFYFPLPYLAIALLAYVLPYGVAFKLVSVSGLVALPLAAWTFGRLTRMRFPGPPLLALATVPFLFERYWTIYGGNIASTLAGEFAFSIALALALVFLGVFSRCLETGRHRAIAAALLAATGLCHLLPTFFAIAGALLLFLLQPNRRRLRLGLTVGIVAACVGAFWLVPFAVRLRYSNDMGWERTVVYLKNLFPWLNKNADTPANYTRHLKIVVALAAAGAVGSIALRRRTTVVITGLGVIFAAAFRWMPHSALWNARMLPFWYLCLYLAAAAGLSEAITAAGVLFGRRRIRPALYADETGWGSPAQKLALASSSVSAGASPAPSWATPRPAEDGMADPVDGIDGPPAGRVDDDIIPSRIPAVVVPALVALLVWVFVGQPLGWWGWLPLRFGGPTASDHSFVGDWATWNYVGYQRKASYPEYRDVLTTMSHVGSTHGCGRAMWEYEAEEDRFGTPMALMLLPMWTHGCIGSMEGLFFESSATVPYHFLNQAELSKAGSQAMRNLPYRSLDLADGIAHLRLLGVRYYMAVSPEAQAQARATPGIRLIARTSRPYPVTYTVAGAQKVEQRQWDIYQVDASDVVTPLSYEPVVITHAPVNSKTGWIKLAVPWYQDPARWDVLLAASGPPQWKRVRGADPSPPRTPVRPTLARNLRLTDDRIAFDVDHPGSPVLVKVSYFPNWQATGAQGPWRVTPNLMVVIPTSTHVELHYGFTPVDNVGRLLTVGGLIAAGAMLRTDLLRSGPEPAPLESRQPIDGAPAEDGTPARDGTPAGDGRPGGDDLDRELAALLDDRRADDPAPAGRGDDDGLSP